MHNMDSYEQGGRLPEEGVPPPEEGGDIYVHIHILRDMSIHRQFIYAQYGKLWYMGFS